MNRISLKPKLLICCLFVALLSSPNVKADDEKIFSEAKQYTVKITTRIEIPFQYDKKGVLSGAGFLIDKNRGWILTNAHVATLSPSVSKIAFFDQDYQPAEKEMEIFFMYHVK